MANYQLVEYIKEQLQHKIPIEQLRYILLREGWSEKDIEEALEEALTEKRKTAKKHKQEFLIITILTITIIMLIAGAYLSVLGGKNKETEITTKKPHEQTNTIKEQQETIKEETAQQETTNNKGIEACEKEEEDIKKDECYQELISKNESIDCSELKNKIERNFCYRAKEAVILKKNLPES